MAQGKLGCAAVLANDVEGIAILVHRVGIEDVEARKNGMDGELETGWDLSALANSIKGPEVVFELTSRVLVTLGARGHLPGGHIEDTLRILKQCVHTLPRGYMLDSFEMYPPL